MCRTCVFGNCNRSLHITSKGSQLAIQFFHYRLLLFPVQLRAVSHSNPVEDHLIGCWVRRLRPSGLGLFMGDIRSDNRESVRGRSDETFSLYFVGGGSDVCPGWLFKSIPTKLFLLATHLMTQPMRRPLMLYNHIYRRREETNESDLKLWATGWIVELQVVETDKIDDEPVTFS